MSHLQDHPSILGCRRIRSQHDDVIKWKHFPRYWPFVRRIHRSPVNSPHKGQWRGALMFSLIYARINGWVNNREAGDLRRHQAHCDVIVMGPLLFFIYMNDIPWASNLLHCILYADDTTLFSTIGSSTKFKCQWPTKSGMSIWVTHCQQTVS